MSYDIVLLSVWTEPVHVNPGYQLIRNEITRCSRILVGQRLSKFLQGCSEYVEAYGDVVRYQEQYPYCPGLLSIAAVLEAAGYSVGCVSLDVEREKYGYADDWLLQSIQKLCKETKIAVGISAVTPEYYRAIQTLEQVKAFAPHLKTLIGGTHVTYLDQEAAADPAVDVVVRGEGEDTALELMDRWSAGGNIEDVLGTTIRTNDVVVRNPSRPLLDMRLLPIPAYHLIDKYASPKVHLTPTYTRGCPHSCSYCVESIFFERRVRHKDPIRFVDELEVIINKTNWRFIHIADSTFGINKQSTAALCDELEKRKLNAVFSVNVRPDVFDYMGEDLVRRLVNLNFVEFYMGMESVDDELLKALHRKQSYSKLLHALHKFKEMGVPFVKLYLIVGAPGDTHEGLQATLNAIRKLHEEDLIYYATAKYFVPTPGTEQYMFPDRNGYQFLTKSWDQYERYNYPPVVEHENLTAYEIEQYLSLLQAMQLAFFRKKVETDPVLERERVASWAKETYYRKVYL